MTKPKLDIFRILKAFDQRDIGYSKSVPEDEKSDFYNFVRYPALRWMSGANFDKDHMTTILSVNLVNPLWFALGKHPDWQASLLAVIGPGRPMRHSYVQPPKAAQDTVLMNYVRAHYSSDLSVADCEMALIDISPEEFKKMVSGMENKADLEKAFEKWRQRYNVKIGIGQKVG